jgi:Flp pilus assembly protein TadG
VKFTGQTRGAITIQMLVILVPVLLVMMGFAIDLGQLYLVRAELKQAANAMALAAAARLNGTDLAIENAAIARQAAISNAASIGNKFNFGSLVIGDSGGVLNSAVPEPEYFDTAASATGEGDSASGGTAGGTTAKYVRVSLTADAPLTLFGLLAMGQERRTQIAASAVAGQSAPLCEACAVENMAVAALDAADLVDFGFVRNTRYTLSHSCTGNPPPQPLGGTTARLDFLMIDRQDTAATIFADPSQQLFRIGQAGLPGNKVAATGCIRIGGSENVWENATPLQCQFNTLPGPVQAFLCGLATRFDGTSLPAQCQIVGELDAIVATGIPDTDLTDLDDYAAYTGNGRRIITIPIVEALLPGGGMVVLGFRQFLVQPLSGQTQFNPADPQGRFTASYIGSVMPLRQGRFDGNCGITTGPGKVVLFR